MLVERPLTRPASGTGPDPPSRRGLPWAPGCQASCVGPLLCRRLPCNKGWFQLSAAGPSAGVQSQATFVLGFTCDQESGAWW